MVHILFKFQNESSQYEYQEGVDTDQNTSMDDEELQHLTDEEDDEELEHLTDEEFASYPRPDEPEPEMDLIIISLEVQEQVRSLVFISLMTCFL
jgi:hypothetical protein